MVRLAATCLLVALTARPAGAEPETRRRVQFNQGIVAFSQRDYPTAQLLFEALLEAEPEDVAARYWLGLCQLQQNGYEEARHSFEQVLRLAPDRVEAKLDAAIALAGLDLYEDSKGLLEEFIAAGVGGPSAQALGYFFLGVAHYKTGNPDAALAALDQARDLDPEPQMQANIAWYRSWIYADQRRFDEASAEFARVSELSRDPDQIARASHLSEQVRHGVAAEAPTDRFQFRVDMGFNYDTNVVLLGDDTSLEVGLSTDDDFRFGLSTDARYVVPLGPRLLVGLGGSTFNSWHAALQEFDVQTYGGRAFINYFANDRVTAGLQYEYDYNLVDREAFLARHSITPSLRVVERFHEDGTPLTDTTLFYSYEPRDYNEALGTLRENRDGKYHTVGVFQSVNVSRPREAHGDSRWLSASLGYRFLQQQTAGDDFDMSGHSLSAQLACPLPLDLLLDFSGQWTWEDYWQPNSRDARLRNRRDFVQRYIWTLSREFELDRQVTLAVRGQIAWTEDDSNIRNRLGEALYSYDRVIYGLTLSFTFR